MPTRRYTVFITDCSSGARRRVTVSVRGVLAVLVGAFTLPVLIGLGAKWSGGAEIARLRARNSALTVENGSYRAATGELTEQIQSLQSLIDDLGARSALDPDQRRAIQKLPAAVKARAAGGTTHPYAPMSLFSSITSPDDAFGVLRDLLQGIESSLSYLRHDVERQEQLAAATPSIWPAHGWLTATFGGRPDPLTGEPGFHQGLDISTGKGQPVYATADGIVESASYTGDYGNLIVVRHDFGLKTRYGHLSRFNVRTGASVTRGSVIGFVGSTGQIGRASCRERV